MSTDRTTIMILVPGRAALSIAAPRLPGRTLIGMLLMPLMTGLVAERCFHSLGSDVGVAASASLARAPSLMVRPPPTPTAAAPDLAALDTEPPPFSALSPTSVATITPPPLAALNPSPPLAALNPSPPSAATITPIVLASTSQSAVVSVPTIVRAIAIHHKGGPTDSELEQVPTTGFLRLNALHLGEEVNVRPFDDLLHPIPDALAKIDHLLRCRVTGAEVTIDRSLVAILVKLHALYGKAIDLVSGHREPRTLGTKPTSQHALGRAADIRIAGVGIEELKRVAIKFGARGVGLYPEKGFVHVDVRQKAQYRWIYTAADGEQPDMGMARPKPRLDPGPAPDSESDAEEGSDDANSKPPAPAVVKKRAPVAPKVLPPTAADQTPTLADQALPLTAAGAVTPSEPAKSAEAPRADKATNAELPGDSP